MIRAGTVRLLAAALTCLLAAACAGSPAATPAPTSQPSPTASPSATLTEPPAPSPTTSPTQPPTSPPSPSPSPSAMAGRGSPTIGCVSGWLAPRPGSTEYEAGIEMLSLEMGLPAELDVVEVRFFVGPDAPWIIEPHYPVVERWYIKASLAGEPAFAGRWLLERRTADIRGISAVAPFDSGGYQSPDWRGLFGDGPPRQIEGLPGLWAGLEYDFVTGEGDHGMPGLPDELVDCLAGT